MRPKDAAHARRIVALLSASLAVAAVGRAQSDRPHSIVSISVCSPDGLGGQGSCAPGSFDTHQIVLAPDGSGDAINKYRSLGGISDEHSSVFPPGSLRGNSDYLFFVASRTELGSDTGVVVLSGGRGPERATGQWTFDIPADYGTYPAGFGQVFLSPVGRGCPDPPGGDVTQQDRTFDLNYAAAGSIVKDPTGDPGTLLMLYEGANKCPGLPLIAAANDGAYITDGVATSVDFGHTWPTYSRRPWFDFVPLPGQNPAQGPRAPFGARGDGVYTGNDTSSLPPPTYGRYAVLSPPVSLDGLVKKGATLQGSIVGDGEPSAFLDEVGRAPRAYLYLVHGYSPGKFADPLPGNRASDLAIARARLDGSAPLRFSKWDGQSFASPGLGGAEIPILRGAGQGDGDYLSCGRVDQSRHMASVYYVETTQQYLLVFVCDSPSDPANDPQGSQGTGRANGAAWFYSTSDEISDPARWSRPQEIGGSWSAFGAPAESPNTSGGDTSGCPFYKGWYPSLMSLEHEPGHLATSGYVFYLWGCQGDGTPPPGRQFSSRAFTIAAR